MLLAHFTIGNASFTEELFLAHCFCSLIGLMVDSKMEVSVRARYCIENTGREGLRVSARELTNGHIFFSLQFHGMSDFYWYVSLLLPGCLVITSCLHANYFLFAC